MTDIAPGDIVMWLGATDNPHLVVCVVTIANPNDFKLLLVNKRSIYETLGRAACVSVIARVEK